MPIFWIQDEPIMTRVDMSFMGRSGPTPLLHDSANWDTALGPSGLPDRLDRRRAALVCVQDRAFTERRPGQELEGRLLVLGLLVQRQVDGLNVQASFEVAVGLLHTGWRGDSDLVGDFGGHAWVGQDAVGGVPLHRHGHVTAFQGGGHFGVLGVLNTGRKVLAFNRSSKTLKAFTGPRCRGWVPRCPS